MPTRTIDFNAIDKRVDELWETHTFPKIRQIIDQEFGPKGSEYFDSVVWRIRFMSPAGSSARKGSGSAGRGSGSTKDDNLFEKVKQTVGQYWGKVPDVQMYSIISCKYGSRGVEIYKEIDWSDMFDNEYRSHFIGEWPCEMVGDAELHIRNTPQVRGMLQKLLSNGCFPLMDVSMCASAENTMTCTVDISVKMLEAFLTQGKSLKNKNMEVEKMFNPNQKVAIVRFVAAIGEGIKPDGVQTKKLYAYDVPDYVKDVAENKYVLVNCATGIQVAIVEQVVPAGTLQGTEDITYRQDSNSQVIGLVNLDGYFSEIKRQKDLRTLKARMQARELTVRAQAQHDDIASQDPAYKAMLEEYRALGGEE